MNIIKNISFYILITIIYLIKQRCLMINETQMVVKPFKPIPINITVDSLPAPYNTSSAAKPAQVVPVPEEAPLYVPENFFVTIYKDGLNAPRMLTYTPTGDILVTEAHGSKISILIDNDNDGTVDEIQTFADASNGVNNSFGMSFINGYFFLGNAFNLRRYIYQNGSRRLEGVGEIIMEYEGTHHWTRNVIIPPSNDKVYVSVGSGSNVDIEYPSRASVQVANFNGSDNKTYAYGLRNPVGLAFHPVTNDLYVTVQERDELGDDLVPDYFTRIQEDDFYGWPFAYLTSNNVDPRRKFSNGSSERPDLVNKTKTPDVLFQAHSSVLGMRFYTGKTFPQYYRNGAFAAFHGSWNRNMGTGEKLVFVPFGENNRPLGYYEDFLYGFLLDPSIPTTFGRPVGLLVLNDGSLLFSDDGNGRIYRVQYDNSRQSTTTPSSRTTFIRSNIWLFTLLLFTSTF
ncbi:unnamed protein product [Didymodactylos carnosus]|uniref:Pyrroloquinoline quinone-dependent pyranose dehydrogenase beta-propeller domain-containing protein n=1 Tax=Didymodactylos carnosus TaxID=1234261 RepID=A0A814GDT0_9BILA|nr:unnamed protein product [Didymodactylos carnosus]CAF1309851.1 unnamed protein product [Didymodactylos carnosus]CAF3766497.1 unnamed protein product [Didymodactylos carnosus]CAF4117567.1 unnamed protein product [Didymodactylos carnosus]